MRVTSSNFFSLAISEVLSPILRVIFTACNEQRRKGHEHKNIYFFLNCNANNFFNLTFRLLKLSKNFLFLSLTSRCFPSLFFKSHMNFSFYTLFIAVDKRIAFEFNFFYMEKTFLRWSNTHILKLIMIDLTSNFRRLIFYGLTAYSSDKILWTPT